MSKDTHTQAKNADQREKTNQTPSYENFMKIYNEIDQKYQNALQKLANQ